jgi:Ubiquitin carboxyl-terminal hydrolase
LALHVQRSAFSPTGYSYKNQSPLRFKPLLDLGSYVTNRVPQHQVSLMREPSGWPLSHLENDHLFFGRSIDGVWKGSDEKSLKESLNYTGENSLTKQVSDGPILEKVCEAVDSENENVSTNHATHEEPVSTLANTTYPYLYQLRAVLLHYGSHNSGHFVAYRKVDILPTSTSKRSYAWYLISDRDVHEVEEEEVLVHGAAHVYMLFYEKLK